jgi:hypothetical protein
MTTLSHVQAEERFRSAALNRSNTARHPVPGTRLVLVVWGVWFVAMGLFIWRGILTGDWLSAAVAAGFMMDQAIQLSRALRSWPPPEPTA